MLFSLIYNAQKKPQLTQIQRTGYQSTFPKIEHIFKSILPSDNLPYSFQYEV